MADPTRGAVDVLVRLMSGELDVKSLDKDTLYRLAAVLMPDKARDVLHRILAELNERGDRFDVIGAQLGIHQATAARWAKPPAKDLRRRRREGSEP